MNISLTNFCKNPLMISLFVGSCFLFIILNYGFCFLDGREDLGFYANTFVSLFEHILWPGADRISVLDGNYAGLIITSELVILMTMAYLITRHGSRIVKIAFHIAWILPWLFLVMLLIADSFWGGFWIFEVRYSNSAPPYWEKATDRESCERRLRQWRLHEMQREASHPIARCIPPGG